MELSEMLVAARENMWKAQERLGIKPSCWVWINDQFYFNCDSKGGDKPGRTIEPYLKCYLKPDLLSRILTREVHWNNAELACDILFDRRPNIYMPDIHTLMSFFHLPRPT